MQTAEETHDANVSPKQRPGGPARICQMFSQWLMSSILLKNGMFALRCLDGHPCSKRAGTYLEQMLSALMPNWWKRYVNKT